MLIDLCREYHPCKKSTFGTTYLPECLSAEDGKCDVYENALFCPKFGTPVGSIKHYGHFILEEKK